MINLDVLKNKWIIYSFIGLFMAGAIMASQFGGQDDLGEKELVKEVSLYKASDLKELDKQSFFGEVKSAYEVDVRAEMPGTVMDIRVKEGDEVEKNQVLAAQDHATLDASVAQAKASRDAVRAALDKMKNGLREEDISILEKKLIAAQERYKELKRGKEPEEIAMMEAQVKVAEEQFKELEGGARQEEIDLLKTRIENAKVSLEDKKVAYDNTKDQVEQNTKHMVEDSLSTIDDVRLSAGKVLHSYLQDIVYPISTPPEKTCVLTVFSAYEKNVEQECRDAMSAYSRLEKAHNLSRESEKEEMESYLEKQKEELLVINTLLLNLSDVVNSAILQNGIHLNDDDQVALINTIKTSQSELQSALDLLIRDLQALESDKIQASVSLNGALSAVHELENSIAALEKELILKEAGATVEKLAIALAQLEQLKLNLELAKKGASDETLIIAQTQIDEIVIQIAVGKKGARSEDILAQEAALRQAEAGLSLAQANASKAFIVSPIKGKIVNFDLNIGDLLSGGSKVAEIAQLNEIQVEAYLSEKQRNLLNVGDEVSILDYEAKGVITYVGSALDSETKKLKFVVAITEGAEKLLLGSSVFVQIELVADEGAVMIPISAVRLEGEKAFTAFVDEENKLHFKEVILDEVMGNFVKVKEGLNLEEEMVYDVSGLKEGETVKKLEVEES